jgi:hypothetical protein
MDRTFFFATPITRVRRLEQLLLKVNANPHGYHLIRESPTEPEELYMCWCYARDMEGLCAHRRALRTTHYVMQTPL